MESAFAKGVSRIKVDQLSQEESWQYWWTNTVSSEDKKKIQELPSVQAKYQLAPHQSAPTWGKQVGDVTLFMMAREETKLLFPKSGIKGIQGKNLFFNNAGNDGRPVVFPFPDIADPS